MKKRKMRTVSLAIAIIASVSGTAYSQQPTKEPPPVVVTSPGADGDKIVCKRRVGAEVGSRLHARKNVCMRAADWKAQEILTEEAKRNIQDDPVGALDPNSPAIKDGSGGGPE